MESNLVWQQVKFISLQMIPLVMGFRRGSMALRPVNRIKHVIDVQFAITAGNAVNQDLVLGVDAPVLANTNEVVTGAKVNAIYLHVEAYATSATALSNFYLIIYKDPGGNLANIPPNTVGANDNKRYVIHQEMVMLQEVAKGNPRTIFNGVIVLPRGYKRFGPNDVLTMRVLAPGVGCNVCLQCHYKEFR